ncbi:hypothetical protein LXL04_016617 [Taraxacum kok-saghyz]
MPPKFDPSQVVDVYVRVTGGEVGAESSLAPKIGPLGLSPKKIGEDIAKETAKDWKGLRVTVKLTVQNRHAKKNKAVDDAPLDKRKKIGAGRMMASTTASRGRQALAPMNNQKDVPVAPPYETEVSECENIEFTKEEVDVLLNEKFKGKKFDSKGKQDWMIEYIKKLKICIKWFQKGLEDLAEEKNKLHTMLDLSEKKFVEAEAAMKLKEEEFKSTISKLEDNISSLKQSLANEESQKLVPKQPGNTECGYYVCKFMKEIIDNGLDVLVNANCRRISARRKHFVSILKQFHGDLMGVWMDVYDFKAKVCGLVSRCGVGWRCQEEEEDVSVPISVARGRFGFGVMSDLSGGREDVSHLLFRCIISRQVWSRVVMWIQMDIPHLQSSSDLVTWADSHPVLRSVRSKVESICMVVIWILWTYRNALVFSPEKAKKQFLFDSIRELSFNWFVSRNPKVRIFWVDWLQNPV